MSRNAEDALARLGNDVVLLNLATRNISADLNSLIALLMPSRGIQGQMATRDRVILEHRDKDGNVLDTRDSGWGDWRMRSPELRLLSDLERRLMMNVGFAEVAGLILSDVTGQTAFDYIAIGTGTTAPSATQTTLVTETHREAGTGTRVTTTVTNDTAQLEYTFSGYGGSEAVTESGVFNAASAGTMLCRQTFSELNIDWDAGDTLKVTWKVQCKQGS